MADLAQYLAETSKGYDNSRTALNNQINAIDGQLQASKDAINKQYAQQQKNLNNQRNFAAENASMQAGGSGGSFGGAANLANRKYYEQTFTPAQTQMQTNQANDLANADQTANNNRLSLQSQLASLNDEATRYAYQRYDNAVAQEQEQARWQAEMAEKQRQFNEQMAQARAQQAALQAALSAGNTTSAEKKNAPSYFQWLQTEGRNYADKNTLNAEYDLALSKDYDSYKDARKLYQAYNKWLSSNGY